MYCTKLITSLPCLQGKTRSAARALVKRLLMPLGMQNLELDLLEKEDGLNPTASSVF